MNMSEQRGGGRPLPQLIATMPTGGGARSAIGHAQPANDILRQRIVVGRHWKNDTLLYLLLIL